ncbi:MAG: prepilin-type N-terminal cleavage/methylation domain-containing protein [Planctomycetaceae bacterium]
MLVQKTHITRTGFTLIELLVSVVILGILTVVTVSTISVAFDKSRMAASARKFQAAIEGIRDRASLAGESRGLRLKFVKIEDRALVHEIQYIQSNSNARADSTVTIDVKRPDEDATVGVADRDEPFILESNTRVGAICSRGENRVERRLN